MLISLLVFLIVSNAVTSRRDKSILFSRIVMISLGFSSLLALNNFYIRALEKGVGIFGGLFNVTTFTQTFNIFIFLVSAIILTLTAFYPRKVYIKIFSTFLDLLRTKLGYYLNVIKQILFFKDEYKKNPYISSLKAYAISAPPFTKKVYSGSSIIHAQADKPKQIAFKPENITISGSFSFTISAITLLLILFIYMPTE